MFKTVKQILTLGKDYQSKYKMLYLKGNFIY